MTDAEREAIAAAALAHLAKRQSVGRCQGCGDSGVLTLVRVDGKPDQMLCRECDAHAGGGDPGGDDGFDRIVDDEPADDFGNPEIEDDPVNHI